MRYLIFLWVLVLALTGCGTTQIVRVPVPIPCSGEAPKKPDLVDTLERRQMDPNIEARVNRTLAGRLQRDQYIKELEAANSGCKPQ